MPECGTWSHTVIPSLGARARRGGGWAPAFRVTRCQSQSGVSLMVWVGSCWVPRGHFRVLHGSLYQSYTDTGQSSDPSGLVRSRRAISGSDGFWHDGTRRGSTGRSTVPYRCTIDVRTPWARSSPRALRRPIGTRRTPGGTIGPRLIGASPV